VEIEQGVPESLICLEFEALPTSQLAYLDRLEVLGCRIEQRRVKTIRAAPAKRVELITERDEINACAQWCRTVLAANIDVQVGVVIPNLSSRYHAVARQFDAVLNPDGSTNLYDLGGGTQLAEQPMWRVAHRWLQFCFERQVHDSVSRLLTSTYFDLPDVEPLPVTLPEQFSLHALVREWKQTSIDPRFVAIDERVRQTREEHTFSEWVRHFLDVLALSGWGAVDANSTQYQVYEHLTGFLERLASQDADVLRCGASEALDILQRTLAEQVFAPEHAPAPIQVMGYLETTGLRFSHLWICGMQESTWPLTPSANPFIPHSVQRASQLPRIDHASELDFAVARLQHWHQSSKRLIFSHAADDGEALQLPSVLTRHLPPTSLARLIKGYRTQSHPYFQRRPVTLEKVEETRGSGVSPGKIRGGSTLLRDQAGCPFRAWAIHRIGLKESRLPHAFPDAMDRGILIHEALHRLLEGHKDQASLGRLEAEDLRTVSRLTVSDLFRRFPSSYREREVVRLNRVLEVWMAFENSRAPFQIDSLEAATNIELSGFELSLRMDRIDRIGEALVVIDYKTGQVRPGRLLGTPLLEPQLPVYAIATEQVAAVCFARVGEGGAGLSGVARENLDMAPARLAKLPTGGWTAVRSTWEQQLKDILGEFKEGYAAVTPRDNNLCNTCHLAAFCRIRSVNLP
ncbi:MAG: PD-(D/E)XK nuclease family protein, partial [Gammaproteobacteria bacterium]|nr:PD-(D/E)XK nuclease family protein [Gammaproteobacteria bacterium]